MEKFMATVHSTYSSELEWSHTPGFNEGLISE